MRKNKIKQNRKKWFGFVKGLIKIFVRKPKYVYVGEPTIKEGSIILSNHVGKTAPLKLELYLPTRFRFWGAHEMNEGFGSVYRYMTVVFYHQKKHWKLWLARLFCCIATPLTYIFYKGLNLISTYKDHRLKKTIKESVETIENKESIVIFPEDSTEGYQDELKGFHPGFILLAKTCYKKGIDVPIYVTYYDKYTKQHFIDKPIMFSQLIKDGLDREKITKDLCDRANALRKNNKQNKDNQQK